MKGDCRASLRLLITLPSYKVTSKGRARNNIFVNQATEYIINETHG